MDGVTLAKLIVAGLAVVMLLPLRRVPQLWVSLAPLYRYGTSTEPNTVRESPMARDSFPSGFADTEAELAEHGYAYVRVLDVLPPHLPPVRLFVFTADDTANATVTFAPDGIRESVAFGTRFADGYELGTTSPNGLTADTTEISLRYARSLDGAARYHAGQVAAQKAQGRTPALPRTVEAFQAAAVESARTMRPIQAAPYVAYYRRSIMHVALTGVLPVVMLAAALAESWPAFFFALAGWLLNAYSLSLHVRDRRAAVTTPAGAVDAA